jgi:hypothetical protein
MTERRVVHYNFHGYRSLCRYDATPSTSVKEDVTCERCKDKMIDIEAMEANTDG